MPEKAHEEDWITRATREPTSVDASLALAGRQISVLIINISEDGCCIQCDEALPIGSTVSIHVQLVTIAATVRWSFAGRTGLRFAK